MAEEKSVSGLIREIILRTNGKNFTAKYITACLVKKREGVSTGHVCTCLRVWSSSKSGALSRTGKKGAYIYRLIDAEKLRVKKTPEPLPKRSSNIEVMVSGVLPDMEQPLPLEDIAKLVLGRRNAPSRRSGIYSRIFSAIEEQVRAGKVRKVPGRVVRYQRV